MTEPREVERMLDELAQLARTKAAPDRHHARGLLVALGEGLFEVEPEAELPAPLEACFERARELGERLGERWAQAVLAELELACAEHVHSVDPRYLSHPSYDWDYTLAARRRLTARLSAASRLGLPLPEKLLVRVEEADRLLAEYLQRGKQETFGSEP